MEEAALKSLLAKGPLPDVSHPLIGRTLLQAQYVISKILKKPAIPTKATLSSTHTLALKESQSPRHKKRKIDIQSDDDYRGLSQGFVSRVANTQVQFMILEELLPLLHLLPDSHASNGTFLKSWKEANSLV